MLYSQDRNLPTNTTYWNVMSQAGTDGMLTSIDTRRHCLRDGSGLALGYGTAPTGALGNPSWTNQGGGLRFIKVLHLLMKITNICK